MHQAQPPPPVTRSLVLAYLRDRADALSPDFFSITHSADQADWTFRGVKLTVVKRTFSQAVPTNVVYEVHMPKALLGPNAVKDYLLAYVLHPTGDKEANRSAFKRCLQQLESEPARDMSQMKVK